MDRSMGPLPIRIRIAAALCAAALLFGSSPQAAQPAKLRHLGGIEEMQTWFNENQGHPRTIFLLSPT